jgi:hypothetical protein
MRRILLCGLLLSSFFSAAQTTLTGTVRDSVGSPIPGVLLEVGTQKKAFNSINTVSDAAGRFQLTWPPGLETDSLRLSARALGYNERMVRLANRSQAVPLILRESSLQLKEVTVHGAPISRSHDTLSYKVDAFAAKQDRVIADVLKKMPGIEVSADGQISYEGRPINKFYINGQDLLEGRYNLASNNLPADAVQSVQILENHQPIRSLDSLSRPPNAALNLKLKEKVTATGQARLGAGVGPQPAGALWNANLSPMLFTGRQQLLDTYQTNNTGQDAAAELKPLTLADLQQQSEGNNQKPRLTGIQELGRPPVIASRYLFNQVHLLSANHLVTLDKENQLRVNATYLHDQQTQRGGTRTTYSLPGQPAITLIEDKFNQLYFNTLQVDLAFIKNVKRYYLKNTLSIDRRWDSQQGNVYRPEGQASITQQARNPFFAATNRLGLVRPLSANKILQLSSLVFYTNSPQQLSVRPGVFTALLTGGTPYDMTQQQVHLGSLFTSNSVGLTASRHRWAYAGTVGFSAEVQRLTSSLRTIAGTLEADVPTQNDLHWSRYRAFAQPSLSYKHATWQASIEAPVSYYTFRAHDNALDSGQNLNLLVAEPRLTARHELGALWYASASAGLRNSFGDISQLNYAYLLRDYRTLVRNDAPLPRSIGQAYSVGIYFKDPLKALFFSASYSLNSILNNRLYSSQVTTDGALTTMALDKDARQYTHSLSSNVSKFFSPWKTNISLNVIGSLNRQPLVLNGILAQTQSRSATAIFKASCSAFEWGSFDYSATLTTLSSQVEASPGQPLALLQDQHASLSVFPIGRHAITAVTDYYASQGPGPTIRAVFADLIYRYTLPTKRKVDLEVRWNNVFDTRQYQYNFVYEFTLAQSTYQLRPSQVMALVQLSL